MYKITSEDIDFCDGYSYILCRRLGKPRCDDALQAARLGLCEAAHKYDPDRSDSFLGYATWWIKSTLYRNHFGMNCTKKDAMGADKKVANFEEVCYSVGVSNEKEILDRVLVEKCLSALTPKQRDIVIAVFLEDQSPYDIAAKTGQSHQNVYDRLNLAKSRLRNKFKEEVVRNVKRK
jgi:RNA polymerase sigma factor (sigma-70 family)